MIEKYQFGYGYQNEPAVLGFILSRFSLRDTLPGVYVLSLCVGSYSMKLSLKFCLLGSLILFLGCNAKPEQSEDRGAKTESPASPQKINEAFDVVQVYYATDRSPSGSREPNNFYGNGRHDIQFGICEVSIPEKHRTGELEKPTLWKLEFRENPEKHVVLMSVKPMMGNDFLHTLQSDVENANEQEAFIFIHGFNVTFKDAARRTAQIAHDLNFQGAPIMYSWPSKGRPTEYLADRTTAEWCESHVAQFIEAVAHESGAKRIHLIAHSMGNRLLTRAVRQMVNSPFSGTVPKFNQIILTAPDIDAAVFREQIAPKIIQATNRVTIYASSHDKALLASRIANGAPRLGQGGKHLQQFPNYNNIEVIDASDVDTSLFRMGHSYFSDKATVLTDISKVMHGYSTGQRNLLAIKKGTWEIRNVKYAKKKLKLFR